MREFIGNTLLHLGLAFHGQECACPHGLHFNRIARWFSDYEDKMTADLSWEEIELPRHWYIGDFFENLAINHFEDVL